MTGLTPEQIAQRRTGVSSTDLRVILAYYAGREGKQVPWPLYDGESALAVYAEKLGKARPRDDTVVTRAGRHLEAGVLAWYAEETGAHLIYNSETWTRTPDARHMATPDGFASSVPYVGAEWGVEAKTVWVREQCARWGEKPDAVPVEYYLQCQWCMYVCEMPRWDIAVLLAGGYAVDFRIYTIPRNDAQIPRLIEVADRFLAEHVDPQVPPEPDGSRAAAMALADLAPADPAPCRLTMNAEEEELIDQLAEADGEYRAAGKRRELLRQQIIARANQAGIVGIETPKGQRVYRDKGGHVRIKV